jgi:hypothetical protein
MKKKQIIQMYRDWRKANGNKKPNRVIVKLYWEDESPADARVDTVAICPFDINTESRVKDDAIVLFYASSLSGLLELMKPDNGSDFIVTEVLEFYKVKH